MQITSLSNGSNPVSVVSAVPAVIAKKIQSPDTPDIPRNIDFSHVTPRQLNEYVDQLIFADRISAEDASGLMNMLYSNERWGAPDTPIDVRARMEGHRDFLLDLHDARAGFYSGLLNQLDAFEATGLGVSVEA
ncbi:hypothetical protein KPL74_21635 [Bacillus sp. NP157]|nr:hypothetical protein KPL74_21635 [Bacillus sp. NP157]